MAAQNKCKLQKVEKVGDILKKVIKINTYSSKEKKQIKVKIKKVLGKIDRECERKGIKAKSFLGGSTAKDTTIRGEFDSDVFVRFNYKEFCERSDVLSDYLEAVLKVFSGVKRIHGSRDYFQLTKDDILFEIVPVLEIKDESNAKNVTDISPLHVGWVRQKIKGNLRMSEEIVLSKIFCKSIGVYGAESYIKGFSGHVLDILTIYSKGFRNLLKKAVTWDLSKRTVIDIQRYYKTALDALMTLNKSKILTRLVVIDPIQKTRNASAVLSDEKLKLFVLSAKEFLKMPKIDYFVKKRMALEDIQQLKVKKGFKKKIIRLRVLEGKEDVIGSKILKAYNFINGTIIGNDFRLSDSGWTWDKKKTAYLWFMIKDEVLSDFIVHKGPPLSMKKNVEVFKRKHRTEFTKGKFIYAKVKRKHKRLDPLLKSMLKDHYLTEKIESTRIIK